MGEGRFVYTVLIGVRPRNSAECEVCWLSHDRARVGHPHASSSRRGDRDMAFSFIKGVFLTAVLADEDGLWKRRDCGRMGLRACQGCMGCFRKKKYCS